MYNITIIYSMHIQIGKCNSNELYNILKHENPEVIFEEFDILRTEDEYYLNEKYKNQNGSTLETFAIMSYLKDYNVKYVPVDTYEVNYYPSEMYKKISLLNKEYDKIFMENINLSSQKGFQFINSVECNNLIENLLFIEDEIINNSNDNKLIEEYKKWKIISNNRDNTMIKNIYDYSKVNKYNNAVFIIGVEHRKSIEKIINQFSLRENIKINWRSWRIA